MGRADGHSPPGAVSTQLLQTRTKPVGRFSKSFLELRWASSQTRTALGSHDLRSGVHCLRNWPAGKAGQGHVDGHVSGRDGILLVIMAMVISVAMLYPMTRLADLFMRHIANIVGRGLLIFWQSASKSRLACAAATGVRRPWCRHRSSPWQEDICFRA